MSEPHSFKKSLFGFNGRDVLNYIEAMQADMLKEKDALSAQIKTLQEGLAEQKSAAEQSAALRAESERACEALRAELAECRAQIGTLEQTVAAQRETIENNAQLSEKIGDVFLDAKNAAAQIIDAARADADQLERSTAGCADEMIGSIDGAYHELNALKAELQQVFDSFSRRLTDSGVTLLSAKERVASAKRRAYPAADAPDEPAVSDASAAAQAAVSSEKVVPMDGSAPKADAFLRRFQ